MGAGPEPGAPAAHLALRRARFGTRPAQSADPDRTPPRYPGRGRNTRSLRHPQPGRGGHGGDAPFLAQERPDCRGRPAAGRSGKIRSPTFNHLEDLRNTLPARVESQLPGLNATMLRLDNGPSLIVPYHVAEPGSSVIVMVRGEDIDPGPRPDFGPEWPRYPPRKVERIVAHGPMPRPGPYGGRHLDRQPGRSRRRAACPFPGTRRSHDHQGKKLPRRGRNPAGIGSLKDTFPP